jgi:hypothetical protein
MNPLKSVSIVIIGNFNPAIIHPEWLDRNQLLPPQEVRNIDNIKKEIKEIEGLKISFIGENIFVSGVEARLGLPSYRINVTPERFEVSTNKIEKQEELRNFVVATFKVLEHTPVSAIGINLLGSLKFSTPARELMFNYFSNNNEKMCTVFGGEYVVDSRITYCFNLIKVQVTMDLDEEYDKIRFNFNYHKDLFNQKDSSEMREYLLENFDSFLLNAESVIKQLFGEPIEVEVGNNDQSGLKPKKRQYSGKFVGAKTPFPK